MKTVVVSAINLFESGPLVVARDFMSALLSGEQFRRGGVKVVLFCHSAELYKDLARENLELIAKPLSRKSWLIRIFYEYVWFWFWSLGRDVDYWISLHDVTPNVRSSRRAVYCHNPAPFYSGASTWRYAPGFQVFRHLYEYFYRINLHKNDWVIVQQQWLREAFVQRFGCRPEKVVVARPEEKGGLVFPPPSADKSTGVRTLVFPAYPRVFKNHEVLVEAMRLLTDLPLKLIMTFSGEENAYARKVRASAAGLKNIEFSGFLSREKLFQIYADAAAMLFPSKLETWGLPLSEFSQTGKPVFAADLPYARESLSGYGNAAYFNPNDPAELASLLRKFNDGEFSPRFFETAYPEPYARGWGGLLAILGLK